MTSTAGTSGLIVAAQVRHRVAHRGEVDHGRHAGEVLHHDARRREGDLLAGLGRSVPPGEGLDVLRGNRAVALGAQEVLEQHLEAERQPRDVVLRLKRVQAEDVELAIADFERGPGVVAVVGHGGSPSGVARSGRVGGQEHEGFPVGRGQ
jgi:hypothetical protein